jgi:methionyl-tRNA formyltransferase
MKVLVLTSGRRGLASRCLPALVASRHVQVAGVVLAHGGSPNRRRAVMRRIRKTVAIGPLGALNGLRLRRWYADTATEDIVSLAQRHEVPLLETRFINSEPTRALFRSLGADLGLSLGNPYIAPSVFSIPQYGMVNVHGELLPEFQGAQGIIWPLYEGSTETGFTIHQIDARIDTGDILFQKRIPILLRPTLRETVEETLRLMRDQVPAALASVCENYENLRTQARPQGPGRSYTTPSFRQFSRMLRNHRALYARVAGLAGEPGSA